MKRWLWLAAMVAALAGASWYFRGYVRDGFVGILKPSLPAAQPYSKTAVPTPSHAATSTAKTKPADLLAWSGAFPERVNLAVPFLSQAPKMNWDAVHEETCEEASSLMVKAYYEGKKTIGPDEGDAALLDLVAYENKIFGYFESTTAEETAKFIRGHLGFKTVLVRDLAGPDDIKRALANGYPVLLPASGKLLQNPNFKNGGPNYHMLVVKGYLADGRWITNDPGTRNGADYIYRNKVLMEAAHDWNGGDVLNGRKAMIVIIPNKK